MAASSNSTNKNPGAIASLLGDQAPITPQKVSKANKPAAADKPGKVKMQPFGTQITEENAKHFEQYLYYAPGSSNGKKTRALNEALAAFFKANAEYAYKEIPK